MKRGDIILVRFPFTDLSSDKLRPALVLSSESKMGDVTVAFITTQIAKADKNDVALSRGPETGLKKDSILKLEKLMTLHKSIIMGRIGELPNDKRSEVDSRLRAVLGL